MSGAPVWDLPPRCTSLQACPPAPLCSTPREPLLEYDQSSHPFRLDLIHDGVVFKDGFVQVPDAPGIGVEVNRDILEKYRIN